MLFPFPRFLRVPQFNADVVRSSSSVLTVDVSAGASNLWTDCQKAGDIAKTFVPLDCDVSSLFQPFYRPDDGQSFANAEHSSQSLIRIVGLAAVEDEPQDHQDIDGQKPRFLRVEELPQKFQCFFVGQLFLFCYT